MFSSPGRKKVRPSAASVIWATAVFAAAVPVAWAFFSDYIYFPLAGMGILAAFPSLYRFKGLRRGLPRPYGQGKPSIINSSSAYRAGILVIIGGVSCMILLFASVFFIPTFALFVIMFSLTGGLPLSQIIFFLMVFYIERASGSKVFVTITDETVQDKSPVLVKQFEMSPNARQKDIAFSHARSNGQGPQ
jgi:hypothetical protein